MNLTNFDPRRRSNKRFFLQHMQICVRGPGHVSVLQWKWELFLSARRVELEVRRHDVG